ncbi:hypothetical protein VN12_05430 [Pirellula sp. SH-Sr6A]|nr:hypothetical protein VN12_05430 [Pirellula sp. SH-Sr6A]
MANKSLFAILTRRLPRANAVNEAGGRAYNLEPKHVLDQVAAICRVTRKLGEWTKRNFEKVPLSR